MIETCSYWRKLPLIGDEEANVYLTISLNFMWLATKPTA